MNPPSEAELDQFDARLDVIPELAGAGIGFVGGDECIVLRPPHHSSGLKTYVVLQEADDGVPTSPGKIEPPPSIAPELVGIGINCTGAVLAWGALAGEGLAAPASGGLSLVMMGVTYAAAVSTSVQCGLSLIRASDVAFNEGQWTRWLDSNDYYVWATWLMDGVSLLGAVGSASAAVRSAQAIRRATVRSWTAILKGLSRAERKRLAEELIRLQKPGLSGQGFKDLIRAGTFAKRLTSAQITERLFIQLKDAISASLSFAGSSTSGLIKLLYVNVVQE